MNPTLCDRDLLEVVPYRSSGVRRGDVVVFQQPVTGRLIVHRVVGVTPRGLRTKGDKNRQVDPWQTTPESVQGRVAYAWRGTRRRTIHGGKCGQAEAAALRARCAAGRLLLHPLRRAYRAVARSDVARRALFGRWQQRLQPKIVYFKGDGRYPMSLRLGRRTIGRFDGWTGTWLIRAPYRLFIDELRLPRSCPPGPGAP
jgi:signal peptidase I